MFGLDFNFVRGDHGVRAVPLIIIIEEKVSSSVSCCCDKHQDHKLLREEKVYVSL